MDWIELALDIAEDVLPDLIEAVVKKRKQYKESEQYQIDQTYKRDRKIKKASAKKSKKEKKVNVKT